MGNKSTVPMAIFISPNSKAVSPKAGEGGNSGSLSREHLRSRHHYHQQSSSLSSNAPSSPPSALSSSSPRLRRRHRRRKKRRRKYREKSIPIMGALAPRFPLIRRTLRHLQAVFQENARSVSNDPAYKFEDPPVAELGVADFYTQEEGEEETEKKEEVETVDLTFHHGGHYEDEDDTEHSLLNASESFDSSTTAISITGVHAITSYKHPSYRSVRPKDKQTPFGSRPGHASPSPPHPARTIPFNKPPASPVSPSSSVYVSSCEVSFPVSVPAVALSPSPSPSPSPLPSPSPSCSPSLSPPRACTHQRPVCNTGRHHTQTPRQLQAEQRGVRIVSCQLDSMLESSLLHSKSFARAKENAVKVGVEKGLTLDTQRKVLLKMGHQRATVEKVVSYMNKRFELLSSNDGTNNNSSDTEGEKKNINGGRATVGGDNGDGVHFSVGTLLRLVDFKEFVVSVALAFYLDEEENEKYTRSEMQKHRARLQALSERFDEAHAHVASTTWLSPTKERLHHTHCDVQKKLQTSSDSSRPRERVRSSSLPHVASSVSAAEATREAEIPKTLRKSSLSSSTGSASPSHVLARGAAVNLEVRASSAGAGASADADIDRSDENCSGVETASRDTDVGEEDRHQHYLKRNTGSIGVKATFHHSMLCDLGGEMVKAGEEAMMVKPIEYEQEQGTGTIDRIVVEGKEKPGRHTEMKERYACNEKEQSAQGREVLEKVGEIRRAFTLIQRAFKSMDVHRTGMLDATQLASALFASSEEKKAQSKLSSSQITPDGDKISGSSIGADRPFQNDMGTEAPRNTHPDADTGRSNSNDPVCSGDRSTRIGIQGNNNNSAPLSANAVTSAATTTAAILAQMAIESGAISNGGDSIYGGGGQSTKAGNTGEVGDGIQWSINVSPLHSLTSKTRRLEQEHARSMLKKGKEKEREIEKERRESWGKSSFSMKHNIMVVGATHGNASTSPVIETSNNDSNRKTHSRRNEGHKTKVKSGSRQKLHHRHSHFKEHIASPAQRAQLKSSISILKERFSELDIDDSGRIDFPGFVFGILSWVGMSDGDEANNNDADGEGSGGLPITAFTNRARENNGEVIGFDRGGNHGKAARNVPDLKKQGCVEESIPLAARGEVAGGDGKSSVGAGTCVSAKNVVQKQAWGGGSPSSNALGATKAKTLASLTTSSLSFKPEIGPSGIANIRPTAIASNRRAIVSGDDNNRRNAQPAYRSSTTRTIVNVKNAEVRVKGRGVGAGSPLHFNPLDEPSFLRRFTEERQL